MSTRGFCSHPGARAVVLSTGNSIILQRPGFPRRVARRLGITEMVPTDSNANIRRRRALPGTVSRPRRSHIRLRNGSLSRIVTTQVTQPWDAGDTGGLFSELAGKADTRWEVGDAFGWTGGQGVAGSNPVSPTVNVQVRGGFREIGSRLFVLDAVQCPRSVPTPSVDPLVRAFGNEESLGPSATNARSSAQWVARRSCVSSTMTWSARCVRAARLLVLAPPQRRRGDMLTQPLLGVG